MRAVVRVPEYVNPIELARSQGLDIADCIFVSSVDPRDEISAQKLPDQLQGLLLKEEQLVGDWPEEIKEHLRRWGRLEAWKRNPNSYEELAKLARRSPLNSFEKAVQSTLERVLITIGQDSELWKAWEQYIDPETQRKLELAEAIEWQATVTTTIKTLPANLVAYWVEKYREQKEAESDGE